MDQIGVYTGRWTDYNKGSILGDLVTLPTSKGNVLVAFIAIFIAFIGTITWSIVAYAIHQARASHSHQDGFHHQVQATLRNRYSPDTFAWRMLRIGFAWRRVLPSAVIKSCGLTTLALIIYAAFIAAGLLLSEVATTGEVLLRSSLCGTVNLDPAPNSGQNATLNELLGAYSAWADEIMNGAYSYAENCYPSVDWRGSSVQAAVAPASNCDFYVKTRLNWTTTYPAKCPFAEGLCRGKTPDIVQFDTGYHDTNSDLGINAASSDRVRFREITTCAPLVTEGYTKGFQNISGIGTAAIYSYGSSYQPIVTPWENYTEATFVYPWESFLAADQPYTIMTASTDNIFAGGQQFLPDPNLAPGHTSITLMFLANRAYYQGAPTNDPWFNATTELPSDSSLNFGPGALFYSESPGSILGCVNEVEFCNPNTNTCKLWPSWVNYTIYGDDGSLDSLELNARQTALAANVGSYLYNSQFWTTFSEMSSYALVAYAYLQGQGTPLSIPISSNQWLVELQRLQAVKMAMRQRMPVVGTLGPSDPVLQKYLVRPVPNTTGAWLCDTQKFRSNDYTTFSVLGIGLIFGFGLAILILAVVLTIIIPWIQERAGSTSGKNRRLQWYSNDLLWLQRTVFKDHSYGEWEGEAGNIPTTKRLDTFPAYVDVEARPSKNLPPKDDDVELTHLEGISSVSLNSDARLLGKYATTFSASDQDVNDMLNSSR